MSNHFYVYVYLDPRRKGSYSYKSASFEYEPFYVGKGHGKRFLQHLKENVDKNCNKSKIYKIRKIKEETGQDPIIIKVKEGITDSKASEIEINLIKQIGRNDLKKGPLTNLTDGGDGASGLVISEEGRLQNSLRQRGEKGNRWGKKNTEEAKEKFRETRRSKKIKTKILQYSLDGSFIKEWDNLLSIRESFDSPHKIKRCCDRNKESIYYMHNKSKLLLFAYHRIYEYIWLWWNSGLIITEKIDMRTILKYPIVEIKDNETVKEYLYLDDLKYDGLYRFKFLNKIKTFNIINYNNKTYKILKND